jgi:indolepyruvate ferredoxin oxidoreductase alpha subunit
MDHEILLGDEAIARGALDAGISGAYAYPGTPSTEVFETVHNLNGRNGLGVHARWSANEKVAMEEAVGMSYAGRRAMVSFKHVGLNVAADPFVNAAIAGAHGGLVIVVADDPSMHSSQNEQDSRFFADFAHIPCFEPASQQEAYDMTREAFDVSERFHVPVMLRVTTRLAHSRSIVKTAPPRPQNPPQWVPDPSNFTLLPSNARRAYQQLLDKQQEFRAMSTFHAVNTLTLSGQGRPGIIACGIAWGYVREALGEDVSGYNTLRVGVYPIPVASVQNLVQASSDVLVLEEGYPLVERLLVGLGGPPPRPVHGRLDGTLPRAGELTPDNVMKALGRPVPTGLVAPQVDAVVRPRPPLLCDACPHRDSYAAINAALADHPQARVMGDIGCYTLGYYKPYSAIHSCLAMGASISMAAGASHAGMRPVLCVIGDSTFTHSGMTPLLDAAREDTDMTVFILDNSIVAMTGGQQNMAQTDEILALLTGLGVKRDHVRAINPLPKHHDENVRVIKEEIAHKGLSVIVSSRICITYAKQIKEFKKERAGQAAAEVSA